MTTTPASRRHVVALITTDDAVPALAGAWDSLWRAAPAATPFQSPRWLLPWWAQFGTGRPRIATLRDGDSGRLFGLLPLYELDEPPTRKLLPFGVGITDYTDALLAPDAPPGSATILLHAALAGAEVEVCDLPDLPPGASLANAPLPHGWQETRWAGDPCPVVTLPDSMAALLNRVSRGTRRYLQQAELRATRHTVTVSRAGPDDLDEALTDLFTLHAKRWEGRGEAGVLADTRVTNFHRAAAPGLLAAGALRLETLRFGSRPVAAHLSLLAPGRLLHYLTGFDPEFEDERPGTLMLGRLIADAVAEGRHELHFLRGEEGYKYAWGGVNQPNTGRHIIRSSSQGHGSALDPSRVSVLRTTGPEAPDPHPYGTGAARCRTA